MQGFLENQAPGLVTLISTFLAQRVYLWKLPNLSLQLQWELSQPHIKILATNTGRSSKGVSVFRGYYAKRVSNTICERRLWTTDLWTAVHSFSGMHSKGLLTECRLRGRNLTEVRGFPPLMPGRGLLNKHIPDQPVPGWTSEVPPTRSKTNHCSNLLSLFKSTLWGNIEMAKTVGIVEKSGRLQRQEENHSLSN